MEQLKGATVQPCLIITITSIYCKYASFYVGSLQCRSHPKRLSAYPAYQLRTNEFLEGWKAALYQAHQVPHVLQLYISNQYNWMFSGSTLAGPNVPQHQLSYHCSIQSVSRNRPDVSTAEQYLNVIATIYDSIRLSYC
jgi:hypothetical protein